MATFYSTAQAVKDRTGIDPADLGLVDDAALTTFLENLLTEISDLMNRRMKKDHLTAVDDDGNPIPIPAGLNGIAADIASDSVREMVATRQTPVVRIDDFAVSVIHSKLFSPDILRRLKLYGVGFGHVEAVPGHIAKASDILVPSDLINDPE